MQHNQNNLENYRAKRRFGNTTEPTGAQYRDSSGETTGQFVIQKHDASSLHFDFRVEVDGVLKSWAVPKGPSLNPKDKQLAVPTEDHPVDYVDFEGTIPEGEYGAGVVLVWDTGYYEPVGEKPPQRELERGRLNVWLEGYKLRGGYTLVRMGRRGNEQWLLIKQRDIGADRRRKPVKRKPRSVLSGEDLRSIAERSSTKH